MGASDEEHKPAHEAKHEYFKNKKQMSGLFANILSFYHIEGSQPAKVQENQWSKTRTILI